MAPEAFPAGLALTPAQFGLILVAGFVALVILVNLILFMLWRRQRFRGRWRCPDCGYDLRGCHSPTRCPECGATTALPVRRPGVGRYVELMLRASSGVSDYERDDPDR